MIDLGRGLVLPYAVDVLAFRTRAAWLAHRRLGASNVAKLLGLSPYGGEWVVYADMAIKSSQRAPKAYMDAGNREEARLLDDYRTVTGHAAIGPLGHTVVHGPEPWQGCSIDSFIRDERGRWLVAELKVDQGSFRWGRSGIVVERWTPEAAHEIREDYAAQLYAQMAWTGIDVGRLIVRRRVGEVRWYELHADPAVAAVIDDRCRAFWRDHVVPEVPPAVDDSDACARALARLYPQRHKRYIPPTPDDVIDVLTIATLTKRAGTDTDRVRLLKAQLAERLGKADAYGFEWPSTDPRKPHRVRYQNVARGGRAIVLALRGPITLSGPTS